MSDALSRTLQHGDFDSVFREVDQSEPIDWATQGELRLFHLDIRNNKIIIYDQKRSSNMQLIPILNNKYSKMHSISVQFYQNDLYSSHTTF